MASYSLFTAAAGIARRVTIAAAGTVILASGLAFIVKAGTNNNAPAIVVQTQDGRNRATLTGSGQLTMSGQLMLRNTLRTASGFISTRTTDIGWTVKAGANTACNTTCTFACVIGEDTSVLGSFVDCTDATADRCICAGNG